MPSPKRVIDEEIAKTYRQTKSVWKTGEIVGLAGQTVHERLSRIGIKFSMPRWTKREDLILLERYTEHRAAGTLQTLADEMKRTKHFICRQAKRLGLTSYRGPKTYFRVWMGMPENEARKHFEKFKRSRLGLGAYCKANKIDDRGFSELMRQHFPDEWDALIESKAPRQSWYRLGRHVEYKVRDELRKLGYFVLRSPRSGGLVDIVAIKTGQTLFIQCKRNMVLTVNEWNAVFDLATSVSAIPILAGRPTGKGVSFKKILAKKTGEKKRQPMVDFQP